MTVAALFYTPMSLAYDQLLWLVLPLSVSLAVVYKTVRTNNIRRLPLEVAGLVGLMLLGLVALGVGLWFIQAYRR